MHSVIQSNYRSWMLRLRRASPRDRWHASLQCTTTSEVLYFADLNALLAYLNAATVDDQIDPPDPPEPP
jgi:hypothetical protein